MKKYLLVLPLLMLLGFSVQAHDNAQDDLQTISTKDLYQGIQNKTLTVVDCNSQETFNKGHIPTAVHMSSVNPDIKVLPKDKKRALVFYCKNPRCLASHDGAHFAIKHGYTNVRIYPLGIDGWIKAGMKTETGK